MFNEKYRVQIPAILHLTTLGYEYLSIKDLDYDRNNNIVDSLLLEALIRINPNVKEQELLKEINLFKILLKNDDLGRAYYNRLIQREGIRFLDLNNIDNNSFHVLYEFPFINKGEEFRPDITILLNGLPLAIAEVKVPMNRELIEAERKRMDDRFSKPWFKEFMNGFQLLVFSNNMEYDDESIVPIQGAFYSTPSNKNIRFSTFREEDLFIYSKAREHDLLEKDEKYILMDTNSIAVRGTDEYNTNLYHKTPTNSILTSLFSKERILYLLNYGICYVDEKNEDTGETELKKHIMRYPQFFASKAITEKLDDDIKKGVIWHTQGSGKTELAFYMNKILTDYYANKDTNAKLFFIVDRLSLFDQATNEFISRGLYVNNIDNRDDFEKIIKSNKRLHNKQGLPEITVVNIQKFSEDAVVIKSGEYDTNIQRIFFIDESHRSYSAESRNDLVVFSTFLMQLLQADKKAVHIGLTGTPIISRKINTIDIFGDYIHKYYYNQSISDGYTLRLFREEILSTFAVKMQSKYNELLVKNKNITKEMVFAHPNYVNELLDYIMDDYEDFKMLYTNRAWNLSYGSMIVCDSNAQAREISKQMEERYPDISKLLVLHDENTKEYREEEIDAFKKTSKYDFVIVDRMLLTGFNCPRLKRMYLLKIIRSHNLLQAITRVNRPFENFKYGYIVDFAGISEEFKKTNDSYLEELSKEYGEEFADNSDIFITDAEIEQRIEDIEDGLFNYDTNNLENFSRQVQAIINKEELAKLYKLINEAKDIYGVAKFSEKLESFKLDIKKIKRMLIEVKRAYETINLKESLKDDKNYTNVLNATMEQLQFAFFKGIEEELTLGDKFFPELEKAKRGLRNNVDKNDPKFTELLERLKEVLENKNVVEITLERLELLEKLTKDVQELNLTNKAIASKYKDDFKYLRIHKRLKEKLLSFSDIKLVKILSDIKEFFDQVIFDNEPILDNEALIKAKLFGEVFNIFAKYNVDLGSELERTIEFIDDIIYKEYINERRGGKYYG